MKIRSLKIKVFFIITLGILGCNKNDESSYRDFSDLGSFGGLVGTEQVSWTKPDYSMQQTVGYWSIDSISYSFQIFNNYDRISLIVKPMKESDFDNTFILDKYAIGVDYNIVFFKQGDFYFSNKTSNDSIELFKIDKLSDTEILCHYQFNCNLYDRNGNYYDRINEGNLVSVFKKTDQK